MAIISNGELAECFRDTKHFYEEDYELSEAAAHTNRHVKIYCEDFSGELDAANKAGQIRVVEGRTLREAMKLHAEFPEKKIAVLSFAASGHPGGGVLSGCHAQEESICRSSTLFSSLLTQRAYEGFYEYHHNNCGWDASDRCIYSPDVVVCKDDSDGFPQRLKHEEFVKVDVITCAAPHVFSNIDISDEALLAMHIKRAKNIMRVAAYNGADILITGAFGCGAFKNPAEIVAKAWHEALKDYREKFDLTAFVIYVSDYPAKKESGEHNLRVFREEFTD